MKNENLSQEFEPQVIIQLGPHYYLVCHDFWQSFFKLQTCINKARLSRAKEAGVEVAEKKEMINTLSKFQLGLERVDSYHHGQLPPLYRQVHINHTSGSCFSSAGQTVLYIFQVVKSALYSYFAVALFSEQEVTNIPHIWVPIFLILKFIFFFGWLEVAKAIDDPWDGNDHEDFKVDQRSPF